MANYGDQYMPCPECEGTAESDAVDVGVGLYISGNYACNLCGWESDADGKAAVATYDDWFPDQDPEDDYYGKFKAAEQDWMVLKDQYSEVARALGFEGDAWFGDPLAAHDEIVARAKLLAAAHAVGGRQRNSEEDERFIPYPGSDFF